MRKARRQHHVITRKVFNNNNKQLYHLILIDCINIVANRRIKLDFPKKFSDKIQHPLKTFYFLYKIRFMAEMQPVGFFLDRYRYRSEQVRPDRYESLVASLILDES